MAISLISCEKDETDDNAGGNNNGPCSGVFSFEYMGKTYNSLEIGDQCWMKENLNVGSMIDGEDNQTDNGAIEKYCYNNDPAKCDEYGGLYQWDEMMQYVETEGTQGICPSGWHIPTDEEWKQLEGTADSQYDYPDPEWDGTEFRGFDAGLNIKYATGNGTTGGDGTDPYGFSARPGGYRQSNGNFNSLGSLGRFFTSTETNGGAYGRGLHNTSDRLSRVTIDKNIGGSVRCIKD